jgi:hypothetical protein
LPLFTADASATRNVVAAPSVPTQVVNKFETIVEAPKTAKQRFRRTKDEIRLGLTIEQAMSARSNAISKVKQPSNTKTVKAAKPVENKAAKRFRRTQQEIELGLSIEKAAAMRGVELAGKPKKIFVERKVEVKPQSTGDLIETLSPRIQARARAVTSFRSKGHKGVITTDMLDLVEQALAAGKVTKCAPFVDKDGFNHFTQEEAK